MAYGRLDNAGSKVAERLEFLLDRHVRVRVAYPETGQIGGDEFTAIYRDTVPLGREYFFVFEVSERHRLVRTSSVIEIAEADDGR